MVCECHCSDPVQVSLGEVLHENRSNHFDPGWSRISLTDLPEGALHVYLSRQVGPRGANAVEEENLQTYKNVYVLLVEIIQGLKG